MLTAISMSAIATNGVVPGNQYFFLILDKKWSNDK